MKYWKVQAHYLLQSRSLDDVVMISAHAGDLVIIPPDMGISRSIHPRIDLAMANIVSTAFESEYGEYETHHGAAYYEMSDGNLQKNPHYPKIPQVRYIGDDLEKGYTPSLQGPLYNLIGNEDALSFPQFPGKIPHSIFCTAKRLGAMSLLCSLFFTSARTFSSVGLLPSTPAAQEPERCIDLGIGKPDLLFVTLAFP